MADENQNNEELRSEISKLRETISDLADVVSNMAKKKDPPAGGTPPGSPTPNPLRESEEVKKAKQAYIAKVKSIRAFTRAQSELRSVLSKLNSPVLSAIAEWSSINQNLKNEEELSILKQNHLKEQIKLHEEKGEQDLAEIARSDLRLEELKDSNRNLIAWSKKLNLVSSVLTALAKQLNFLVGEVRKLQQQFGITAGAAAQLRLSALAQSVQSFTLSLSTAPVSFKEIEAAASDLRAEFGGIVSSREAREFAVAAKEMGVTTQQLAAARRVFMTQTMGDLAGAQRQQERFIRAFTQQGMTSRDAMEFIGSNSELLARNGIRFQQSMAKAAGEAKKIGVDLSKVNQVGDNIIGNFEGFLESMAELGAMGFGFDASRLAEIAERGDTSALFDELRSQLRMTGRDLTDLTRSQQLALSSAFGMNIEDFQRMAGVTPDIGEAEETNRLLKFLIDTSERMAGIMNVMATALKGAQLYFLAGIYKNTLNFLGKGDSLTGRLIGKIPGLGGGSGTGTTTGGAGIPTSIPGTGGTVPDVPPKASGTPGILDKILKINPSQLLATGAAMIMIAGATFILAKAMQEFSDVGVEDFISGIGALTALTVAMILMGKTMTVAAKPILIGAAAMTVVAGSLWVLGKAIQAIGVGFGMIGTGIATAVSSIASVVDHLDTLISRAGGIGLLTLALTGLAVSLAAVGAAGLLALPTLLALGAIIGGVGLIAGIARRTGNLDTPTPRPQFSDPGYGDRVLITPNETIAINNDDNLVAYADDMISTNAGTELLSKGIIAKSVGESEPNINVNVDLEKLERKLDQVISAMGSMQVIMDGNKVGRVMSDNEQKASTMGVFQTQRLTG
jgi:hypothetical protein